MPSNAPLRLAVIGSGPAGCYLAQSILRARPAAEVTLFDRLPSPYGLVRYGVPADPQHTQPIIPPSQRPLPDSRATSKSEPKSASPSSARHSTRSCWHPVWPATALWTPRGAA